MRDTLYIREVRKTEYLTRNGAKKEISFSHFTPFWFYDMLCPECRVKVKTGKYKFGKIIYLETNWVCQKCRDMILSRI